VIDLGTYIKFNHQSFPGLFYGRIIAKTSERYGISIFDPQQITETWFAWIFLKHIKKIYINREEMLVEFIMEL